MLDPSGISAPSIQDSGGLTENDSLMSDYNIKELSDEKTAGMLSMIITLYQDWLLIII